MDLDTHVAIVGGGPAGTSAALALAHAAPSLARRVVLLEKATYPRDKPCAGAIGARGDALLREIGIAIDVASAPIDGMSFRGIQGTVVSVPGRIGRVVRRREFDHALACAVEERGVCVRDGVGVTALRDEGTGGVVLETTAGTLRTAVVVGCDGIGSIVRRSLGIGRGRLLAQVAEVDTEPLAADRDRSVLRFDASDRTLCGYTWDFPAPGGRGGPAAVSRGAYVFKGGPGLAAPSDAGDVLASRLRALGLDPATHRAKRYAERGFDPAVPLARGACMLAGEAAGIDALTGEGIAQAVEYGILAGRFLARRLGRFRSGAFDASDWNAEVRRSRLARDLRMRARFVPIFYGPGRAALQRFFVACPSALSVGARHFGACGQRWSEVGDVAVRGSVHAARGGLETAVGRALRIVGLP